MHRRSFFLRLISVIAVCVHTTTIWAGNPLPYLAGLKRWHIDESLNLPPYLFVLLRPNDHAAPHRKKPLLCTKCGRPCRPRARYKAHQQQIKDGHYKPYPLCRYHAAADPLSFHRVADRQPLQHAACVTDDLPQLEQHTAEKEQAEIDAFYEQLHLSVVCATDDEVEKEFGNVPDKCVALNVNEVLKDY